MEGQILEGHFSWWGRQARRVCGTLTVLGQARPLQSSIDNNAFYFLMMMMMVLLEMADRTRRRSRCHPSGRLNGVALLWPII
jgi:hypothetical protein